MAKPLDKVTVAQNRKARHNYTITDTLEAGLVLHGTEVKSLRAGRANIRDAYATEKDGEIWLLNAHIEEYKMGNRNNHQPLRHRKLLLKKREIKKLIGLTATKGATLVPLELFFNERGIAKIIIGIATGKKQHEKREAEKERDWKRQQAVLMKNNM